MSIKTFALSQGVVAILKSIGKQGLVNDFAERIQAVGEVNLGSGADKAQIEAVRNVLQPLSRAMLIDKEETLLAYREILALEFKEVDRLIRRGEADKG